MQSYFPKSIEKAGYKSFFDSKDPMAKQNRDKEVRLLRIDGYTVKTSVCHFDTTTVYYFHAVKAYPVI